MKHNNSVFLQKQIKLLHSKSLSQIVEHEIKKLKKEAYSFLLIHVNDVNLSIYQVINMMKLLFIMRHYDCKSFVEKMLDFTEDKRINVRSYSVVLIVTLLNMQPDFRDCFHGKSKTEVIYKLKKAIKKGISPGDIEYVNRYIENN